MSENVNPNDPYRRPVNPYPTPSRPPPGVRPVNKQEVIRRFLHNLNGIYDKIQRQSPGFLHSLRHHEISITCKELKLDENGLYATRPRPCFFNPASLDVREHPIAFDLHDLTAADYDDDDRKFQLKCAYEMIESHAEDDTNARQSAYMLCYEMNWGFDIYPRKGTMDDDDHLRSLTSWHPARNINDDAIFGRRFEAALFHSTSPSWSPAAAYIDRAKRPHVMFTMRHDFQPMGEELLRGEALAITAAILTRLDRFRSTGHAYVPVLVLSFFGNLCGRILQAYFNGTNLVIWKTNIYHFTPENASKWFGVFMQQMTSFPVGDTKTLEQQPQPQPQQKAPSSSSLPLR